MNPPRARPRGSDGSPRPPDAPEPQEFDAAGSGAVELLEAPDRRLMERRLGAATPQIAFERLLEALPVGAYTTDADGLITYFNEAAVRSWGRAPKLHDPVDRWCGSFRLFIHGEEIRHDECWMARAIREQRAFNGEEIAVERPDGSRITVLAHANPIFDEDGRLIGGVNCLVDISDRKLALQAMTETDRRRDLLLAKLAQELRGQLGPVRSVLQVLRDGHDASSQEHARILLQRQIEAVVQLVDSLGDVSDMSRGRLALRRERIDLATVVRAAVRAIQQRADAAGHQIVLHLAPAPIAVAGDHERLVQALVALLANAVRFTERGSPIRLGLQQAGSHAVLSVRDQGIGISATDLPQIFDLVTNMGRTVSRETAGLGVGLALVRGIVELHGGLIEARSEGLGHGSEFIVRLPVAADPRDQTA